MRTYTTQQPLGNDAATDAAIRIGKRANNELQFFDSTTVKVEHTVRGIRLHVKSSIASKKAGIVFRGEYDPTASYNVNDMVVIRSGPNAGSYICIQANSGNSPQMPDLGNLFWINLNGNAPTMGQWI